MYLTLVQLILFLVAVLFFSSLSTSGYLPTITSTNGSQTQSQGIGTTHFLPSLTVESVLFVANCPFNLPSVHRCTQTHDLDLVITFTKNSVILQEWILGWMIGVRCESHGLYYLSGSPRVCSSTIFPLMIHAQFGHPGLPTL